MSSYDMQNEWGVVPDSYKRDTMDKETARQAAEAHRYAAFTEAAARKSASGALKPGVWTGDTFGGKGRRRRRIRTKRRMRTKRTKRTKRSSRSTKMRRSTIRRSRK